MHVVEGGGVGGGRERAVVARTLLFIRTGAGIEVAHEGLRLGRGG
jgi:hypothetical protein